MRTDCKNCGTTFDGRYCNQCGQPAATHAINTHYLWHDIQHGLLHVDKGLLYTAKELFTRPGQTIQAFIAGKRVQHFKPISLVLVLAGAYGFLYHSFHINVMEGTAPKAQNKAFDPNIVNDWIGSHYAASVLILLPLVSWVSYICFRKAGYNFLEHFVLNAFLTGQMLFLRLALFPLLLLMPGHHLIGTTIPEVLGVGITIWTFYQFFSTYSPFQRVWRSILYYVLITVAVIVLSLLVGIIMAIVLLKNGH